MRFSETHKANPADNLTTTLDEESPKKGATLNLSSIR